VRGHKSKGLQKDIRTLLEASLCHFQITPPSHFAPQKVEGFVIVLTGTARESIAAILDHTEILSRQNMSLKIASILRPKLLIFF
jgi:hypothetical protein